jgi:N-acetyl-gamma-glutamyl-phosphate reductase common form
VKIGVAILGGTGFGGGELLRLLAGHPNVAVVAVTSRSMAGQKVSSVHPHLASVCEMDFTSAVDLDSFGGCDAQCVISALPHGESAKAIQQVMASLPDARVIDLSGDLRLKDVDVHLKHYEKTPELAELRSQAVYGLPEAGRNAIETAKVIANPGCLATATTLALLPFAHRKISSVHLHLATGSSGSGKDPKASTHHPVRHANFLAYKVLEHQHVPEVIQCLNRAGGSFSDLPFVAHSLPISRGILCTAFLELETSLGQDEVESWFGEMYRDHPFVRLKGSAPAEIENVVGSSFCDISVTVKDKQVVVHAAIDNLVKGMAGQAIQNMNLMFGLPETSGLWFGGWRPV